MDNKNLFGTDGIRANNDSPILACANIARLGRILAKLAKDAGADASITIGRDTRASGERIETALADGIAEMGVDSHLVGVLPTSGIAFWGQKLGSYFSVVISASHNPASDNGLKIFGPNGRKISIALELSISEQYYGHEEMVDVQAKPGLINQVSNAQGEYLAMLNRAAPAFSPGLRIVVDCGHGAASQLAEELFTRLGCEVKLIGAEPDGLNINHNSGSEHPANLQASVLKFKADVGIGFDGDADRMIIVQPDGEIVPGDAVIAAFAIYLNQAGLLKKSAIATTVMSSIALDHALTPHGIEVIRSDVGDRQVTETLDAHGLNFGGESSGHLIFLGETTSSDGLRSAIQLLAMIGQSSLPLTQILSFYQPTPFVLKNIVVEQKIPLSELPKTCAALASAQFSGRALLRYSGTEMKARLLVEATTEQHCQQVAQEIIHHFTSEIAARSY